ncbi:MAG: DUF1295 domain-containing protein [Pseudomonadales bacterium]
MRTAITLTVIWSIAALIAFAGSDGSVSVGWLPLFALCVLIAFVMQWLAFIPSWLLRTEKFYDLTGGITYVALMVLILATLPGAPARAVLIGGLVSVWAVRLSSFLFMRISNDGFDRRFDKIKTNFGRLFITWNLQALWVSVTAGAAMAAMSSAQPQALGWPAALGVTIWLIGFIIEATADAQKRRFRATANKDQEFIQTGLWAYSQHPNYFGEIVLWCGIALIAVPALSGLSYLTLISPIFVYLLLTRISGINLLDAAAKKRWGDNEAFQKYKRSTATLVPSRPKATD